MSTEVASAVYVSCRGCEVEWRGDPTTACFCCGRAGTAGRLAPLLVYPRSVPPITGPLLRPGSPRLSLRD